MSTTKQKIYITIISAGLFLIVSSPVMYKITSKIGLKTSDSNGCPNTWGLVLHTIVFALIVYGIMLLPKYK